MATATFICDVEASEECLKTAVSSHQLRHQVCSYSLLQVLVGVLAILVVALTGGVIWMKLFQDCQEELWHVRFTGTNTTFIAPRTQEYIISGMVSANTNDKNCKKTSFRLRQIHDCEINEIMEKNVSRVFFEANVKLREGARLSVQFNCISEIDEKLSELYIYRCH